MVLLVLRFTNSDYPSEFGNFVITLIFKLSLKKPEVKSRTDRLEILTIWDTKHGMKSIKIKA
jgi:hypothetical protein